MADFSSAIWNKPAAAGDVVTKSLRLDGASDSRLTWTPSSASSSTRQKCVISFWIKKTILGASSKWDYVFSAGGTPWFGIAFGATSSGGAKQHFMCGTLPGVDYMPATYAEYRDPAAWSHYTIVLDTTQSTAADRMKVWKDGVALTWGYHLDLFPAEDSNLQIGDAVVHSIGFRVDGGASRTMSGYVADFYLLEHTTLPSGYTNWYDVFAEEDSTTGQWKPKATSGLTFGANGFHLDFEDDTAIGNDVSGNDNDFTGVTNLVPADIVNDTPTENYCVYNGVFSGASGLSEGNLKCTTTARGTFDAMSFASYWEIEANTTSDAGVISEGGTANTVSVTSGNTFGFRLSAEGALEYTTNGSSWASIGGTLSGEQFPYVTGGTTTANFGQSTLSYSVPSGYAVLSTGNLPTPTIAKPAAHFDVLTYSGSGAKTFDNGTTTMKPDLVWVKARGNAYDHELTDSVRGVEKPLSSNTIDEEGEDSDGLTVFGSDGFTVGAGTNYSTSSMVAWAWKAGVEFEAEDGVSDSGSKNATAGFSIATWEGDDSGNGGGGP